ncbi:MAG TPA: TRAP transporter large permease, partial [Kiloniellaceae bacterium]|nr:TRAP transporter large permease [Kiloniellaceae bacterium]
MLMLLIFIALIVMICLNVPIAVALAVSGVLGLLVTEGPDSLVT